MSNDEQVFENYESAISAIEKISEESASPYEEWRRLEGRSFAWSSPGIVTITDRGKITEADVCRHITPKTLAVQEICK